MLKRFETSLRKTGVDLDKFEALLKQREPEVNEKIGTIKKAADAKSSAMRDTMQRTSENWRAAVGQYTTLAPPASPIQYNLLDTAAEVSVTSGITLSASHLGPTNNTAEFQLDTTAASGTEEVGFGFVWQNPSDKYALVNVDGYLVLTAVCQAISDGGITANDRHSSVTVDANLHIFELWNQPPTSPMWQMSQAQRALSLYVNTGGWFDDKKIVSQNLFRGFDLQYQFFIMPPKGVAMFEVACTCGFGNSEGEANFVFRTLGRQVLSPAVLVAVLT